MTDKQLQAFLSIAEKGSFSAAAAAFFITPQAMAQQINQLEEDLGFALFSRGHRGVKLTPAGEVFLGGARQLLEQQQLLVERSRAVAENVSTLRIGQVPRPMLLTEICDAFFQACPGIQQQIILLPGGEHAESVKRGIVDVSETARDDPAVKENGLRFTPLVRASRVCLMARTHPLAKKGRISLEDLESCHVYVTNKRWMPDLLDSIRRCAPGCRLDEKTCEMNEVFNICFNHGLYIMPETYAPYFTPLLALPLDIGLRWDFGLICRENPSPAVEKFLSTAAEVFARKRALQAGKK